MLASAFRFRGSLAVLEAPCDAAFPDVARPRPRTTIAGSSKTPVVQGDDARPVLCAGEVTSDLLHDGGMRGITGIPEARPFGLLPTGSIPSHWIQAGVFPDGP